MVVLDTTILIDVLKKDENAIEKIKKLEENESEIFTTQINVFELIQGTFAFSNRIEEELMEIDLLIQRLKVLDLTSSAANKAGMISGNLIRKKNFVNSKDILIAVTALANNEKTIVTRNTKDFKKIPGIKVETY